MRSKIIVAALLLAIGSTSQAAEICNSKFFSLPTVSVDNVLLFVAEQSAPTFCSSKGFGTGLVVTLYNSSYELQTLLPGMDIHIFDILKWNTCDFECDMTVFVECVPQGQERCPFDDKINLGNNNVGERNGGNNNTGNMNFGSNNLGNCNQGDNNTGRMFFCHNSHQGSNRCTLDMLRTADTVDLSALPIPISLTAAAETVKTVAVPANC